MLRKLLFLAMVSWIVTGCGLFAPVFGPVSQKTTSHVDQGQDEGYLRFTNITAGHEIVLDGQSLGSGSPYTDGSVLGVSPGTHEIEIRQIGGTTLKRKVFVGTGATHTIQVQ